ncbi:hypothetical protein PQA73_gp46 [Erwinia phage Pavtok]|uniref:Uncharacterized protein n=1 Tax=Erwinia phage Pavtok TaxID=2267655 RepID=A0A345BM03_9CAUD|nr:hypothetical protein PQA73_gp46 [Erwinia phage Pavtok]AXF51474.1 hypothetical protein PAVTOK_46 [Erwinia phage Pavtok]
MTDFQKQAQEAIMKALRDGSWHDIPWLASSVREHGMDTLLRETAESDKTTTPAPEADVSAEEEGPGWPEWAAWRLILPSVPNTTVVFFSRRPAKRELTAFAAAAGVAVDTCRVEERV